MPVLITIMIPFFFILYGRTAAFADALGLPENPVYTPAETIHAALWQPLQWWGEQGLMISSLFFLLGIGIIVIILFRRKIAELENKLKKYSSNLQLSREYEKFMDDIIKHFNDYLFFHDMDGNFLEYNPAYRKESDYSSNDIQRMTIRDVVPDHYKKEVDDYLDRVRKNGFDTGRINVVNRSGESGILEYICSVIHNQAGSAIGVRGISRDITERVQAKKALRESEKKYRNILESIEDGYYEVDLKGNYRFFNTPMCRMLGYPCDELYGKNYRAIVHEDYQNTVFQTFNYVYRTGKPVKNFDWQVVRKDDVAYFIEQSISLCKDDNNNPTGFQGIIRDVTERIEAQTKRRDLEEQLNHAQKMESIGTLAGGIAHDFNNILFPIIGFTDLAMKSVPLCSKSYENLEKILKSANRARELIDQILNFSRHSGEKHIQSVLIQPVIKETLKLLKTTIPANIDIRYDIRKDTGKVLISHSQVHQVIMNLCTNAYHAMEEDPNGVMNVLLKQTEVADETSAAYGKLTPGPYILLSVSDTGCGIEPDLREKIFEPYFTTKTGGKGTGLGISVSYGIVKNAGGTILVDSEPGKWTRFDVYLPVANESEETASDTGVCSMPDPLGKERVLLVDDEKRIEELLQQMLEGLGYHVVAADGSVTALEIFRSEPGRFDLLLTDQTMPNMTGIELTEKIRELRPDIPVLLCTGYNDKTTRQKAAGAKINYMLQKPFTKSDLAFAMRKVLDNE